MIEMTNEMETKIYEALEYRFGATGQITVAVEEMAELTQALTKWLRYYHFGGAGGDINIKKVHENIREEIADVSIMLNQLELMFGDTADIQERKLQRAYDIVADLFDEDGNIKTFRFLNGEDEE